MKKLLTRFKPSSDDGIKAVKGGVWLSVGSGGEQVLRLLRNMLLARVLAPEDFGIMAIVLSVHQVFESLTGFGIRSAIIQSPRGNERTYLNGAWWFSFGRALLLYTACFVSAPFIADFYDNPVLVNSLRIAFLNLFFIGTLSPGAILALKRMKYLKWVIIQNGGGFVGIVTAIIMSQFMPNLWALIIGFVTEGAARFIFSYIICPYIPTLNFDKKDFRALLKFAGGMFGLPILTFIFMKTDVFVVGKLCTMEVLGVYSLAISLAYAPLQLISSVIPRILLPVFSKNQYNKDLINRWILSSTKIIIVYSMPVFFFVGLYGHEILELIYGAKYVNAAIPFIIVFFVALMKTSSVPIATAFISCGLPAQHRLFVSVRAILLIIMIVPMVKSYGIIGAASAPCIAMFISYILQTMKLYKVTKLSPITYIKSFIPGFLLSFCVLIFWLTTIPIKNKSILLNVAIGAGGVCMAYIIFLIKMYKSKKNITVVDPMERTIASPG